MLEILYPEHKFLRGVTWANLSVEYRLEELY